MGSDAPEYYEEIVAWLDAEPSVRLAFQPGTFQIAQGVAAMRGLYRRSDLLVCNREEAVEIGGGDHARMDEILESLHRLGPTHRRGDRRARGRVRLGRVDPLPRPGLPRPCPPKERTGAGDAFSSALVAGLVKGLPLETALAWGPVNAMSVVQEVGSQTGLLREGELLEHLKGAPEATPSRHGDIGGAVASGAGGRPRGR